MNLESIITPQDFPQELGITPQDFPQELGITPQDFLKNFSELPLNEVINIHLLHGKNQKAKIMEVSKENDCIQVYLFGSLTEGKSWAESRNTRKKVSNKEFEMLIENIKSAGWDIEAKKNKYILHF